MAGRPVLEKTQNQRIDQVSFLARKGEKVADLVRNDVIDARNRVDAFERRKKGALAAFEKSSAGMRAMVLKMNPGASEDEINEVIGPFRPSFDDDGVRADLGRIAAGDEIVNALFVLAKRAPALLHALNSGDGKDLVNAEF